MQNSTSSLPEDGNQSTSRRYRTMMCSQCRHDKQKCNPIDRTWDRSIQQKCYRCSKLGYDCGPSQRAPRRVRKRSPALSTAGDTVLRWFTHNYHDSPHSSIRCGDLASRPSTPLPLRSASLSPEAPESICLSPDITSSGLSHSSELWLRGKLARLSDMFATRELLRWELELCGQVERWLGSHVLILKVRAAVQGTIDALQEDFEQCVKETRTVLESGPDRTVQVSLLELCLIAYKFANPPTSNNTALNQSRNDCERQVSEQLSIQRMVHTLHQHAFVHSDADHMCAHIWDPTPYAYSTSKVPQAKLIDSYRKASVAIGSVLSRIVPRKFEHRELLLGPSAGVHPDTDLVSAYPVYHLAMLHGPPLLSSELCRSSATQDMGLDCFRRTPVHAAAYTSKTLELRSILEHDSMAAMESDKDIFGLTPLMIAACKDDVKTATLLLRYSADPTVHDSGGRNLLALAARNDSQNVIRFLLNHAHVSPSLRPDAGELCEAITHNRRDIIDLLVGQYKKHNAIDEPTSLQIQAGITTAKWTGLNDVANSLENLKSSQLDQLGTMCEHGDCGCGSSKCPYLLSDPYEEDLSRSQMDNMMIQEPFSDSLMSMDWNFPDLTLPDYEWVPYQSTQSTDATVTTAWS